MNSRRHAELINLRANITRLVRQLDDMRDQWEADNAPCCPNCMFGEGWRRVEDALRRRARWDLILSWKCGVPPMARGAIASEYAGVDYGEPGGMFNLGRGGLE